jgi:hypothetical protein
MTAAGTSGTGLASSTLQQCGPSSFAVGTRFGQPVGHHQAPDCLPLYCDHVEHPHAYSLVHVYRRVAVSNQMDFFCGEAMEGEEEGKIRGEKGEVMEAAIGTTKELDYT